MDCNEYRWRARAHQLLGASGVNFSSEIRATTGSRRSCTYEDGNILAEVNSPFTTSPGMPFRKSFIPVARASREPSPVQRSRASVSLYREIMPSVQKYESPGVEFKGSKSKLVIVDAVSNVVVVRVFLFACICESLKEV